MIAGAVPVLSYVYITVLAVVWGWLAKRRGDGPGGPSAA